MSTLNQVVEQLRKQQKRTEQEIAGLSTAIKALGGVAPEGATKRRKPKFTKAGLARIAAAQRARWAKIRAEKGKYR
jgi:hypothetical protein